MSILSGDPFTQISFSVHENKGVFAVLIGSGLSRSASIPTGWEITLDLVRRVATSQGVEEQADWAEWYRQRTGQEPNYSTLLEELATSPDERRAILHRYIEPSPEERDEGCKTPTKAHRSIAQLVRSGHFRVIVTTNFDRLMENALREQGVEPTVVASPDALAGAEPLTHSRCYLLKLHGDYKDARILNTDEELSGYPACYDTLLDRIFDEHGLIICGWSGEWDHALRRAFLRAPNRRYPVYWAARGSLGTGAQELADHRSAKVVSIAGADEFFQALQQRVETLELSQRQNPFSIEAMVASVKRYVAKPEHRVQLDELISQEAQRLMGQIGSAQFGPHAQVSQQEIRTRVARYESQTEALARMAGILGRWGDGSELQLIVDLIRSLYVFVEKDAGGMQYWSGLRSYPAVLVFTAYGVALTRAERWRVLRLFLITPWPREYKDPQRVVSTLFLHAWKGHSDQIWQQLDGLDLHKTPLSDHLFAVMSSWCSSFMGVSVEFELLFARFETLAALAHLEDNSEEYLEIESSKPGKRPFAGMPVGRAGWSESSTMAMILELQSDPMAAALVSAGFGKGSRRFIELFVDNFKRFAYQMSW